MGVSFVLINAIAAGHYLRKRSHSREREHRSHRKNITAKLGYDSGASKMFVTFVHVLIQALLENKAHILRTVICFSDGFPPNPKLNR